MSGNKSEAPLCSFVLRGMLKQASGREKYYGDGPDKNRLVLIDRSSHS